MHSLKQANNDMKPRIQLRSLSSISRVNEWEGFEGVANIGCTLIGGIADKWVKFQYRPNVKQRSWRPVSYKFNSGYRFIEFS